jgi:ribonuclease-3
LLGFTPGNTEIYRQAFTHKSAIATKDKGILSNERLEYLGDAVLSLILAEYLYHQYPEGNEGFLSQLRARVVNRELFNEVGLRLGIDKWMMKLAPNTASIKHAPDLVGNSFEALVGAIFLDKGYSKANEFFIQNILAQHIDIEEVKTNDQNFKSRLLEWSQKNARNVEFRLASIGKAGQKLEFLVEVLVEGEIKGTGRATKKKKAEQIAAAEALGQLGIGAGELEN